MRCKVCREPAVVEVRRHNAAFCRTHFIRHCQEQVQRTVDDHKMIVPGERALIAVSGGKDSLAVWDILLALGHEAHGLYVGLGIDSYSDASAEAARAFARERSLRLLEVDVPREHGFAIPSGAKTARRNPCSLCGTTKRHLFDEAARRGGYEVLVTGHNLDDEAAVLFGNVLRWNTEYLARQLPVLREREGFPRKVKPLIRLGERELAAYCILEGISYIVEECPLAAGNRHLRYKEALNEVEIASPGSKHDFYFGFLERASHHFRSEGGEAATPLHPCATCGAPTPGEVCAFCRLSERAGGEPR